MSGRRGTEFGLIMLGITVVCGLAAACSVWSALDGALTTLLLGCAGVLVAGYLGRDAVRELRFRLDMRALDRRDAARTAAGIGGRR